MLKYFFVLILFTNCAFATNGSVGETSVGSATITLIIPARIDVVIKKQNEKIELQKNFKYGIDTIQTKTKNNTTVKIFIPKL